MPDAAPTPRGADANLLYGMLALQMNFVGRDALLAAMQAWVFDKARPLGQILQEQGRLTPERRLVLDNLLAEHLKAHDGDPHRSLAAAAVPDAMRDELRGLADADVQASLAALDPDATSAYAPPLMPEAARYRVLRLHAHGGLGEVFVALDLELNREVAVKQLQPQFAAHDEYRIRFLQEAEITGALEHPGVVPVYGLGAHPDGRPYYAMRLIQGDTLKDAARKLHAGEPGLTLRGLLTRFVAVCYAVAYAHSRGVLHRDLKPANVLLGKYGETLVVDWGLAKAAGHELAQSAGKDFDEATLVPRSGDSSVQTQLGSAVGTPAYMSPEQAAGGTQTLGPTSDVYSLGATLYTVLTGRPPIETRVAAEALEMVRKGDWKPPRQVNRRTPAALDAVCRKAMALKPEDRHPTALALAADVEAWLADEPVSAWREPWTLRLRRWVGRHRTLVSAAAGTVLAAMLALGIGVVLLAQANDRERGLRATAENKEKEARERGDEVRRQREEIRRNLYAANVNLAGQEWENGNLAHMRELLDACAPAEGEADLRGWEWRCLDRLRHAELRVFTGHRGDVHLGAYSPDGTLLASGGDDGLVRVVDAATGEAVHVLKGHAGDVLRAAFSPDGARLASGSRDTTVRLWNLAAGGEPLVLRGHTGDVYGVAFSPDGSRLASASYDGTIRVWDAAGGGEPLVLRGHKGEVRNAAYSPDGSRLASAGLDGTLRIWDAAGGAELAVFHVPGGGVRWAAYSPDGTRLATAGSDGVVRILDAANGAVLRALPGHTGLVIMVAYSPDGLRLASCGTDGTVRVWDAVGGAELGVLRGHTGEINGVAYSPDGLRLASGGDDETVRIWDAAAAGAAPILPGHAARVDCLAFSPDGSRLASGGEDGAVRVWDPATGRKLRILPCASGVQDLAFSPDGSRLASVDSTGTRRTWDAVDGRLRDTAKGPQVPLRQVVSSPDGRRLAAGAQDGSVWVWDAAGAQGPRPLNVHTRKVRCLAFSPDGTHLATGSNDSGDVRAEVTLRVWDLVAEGAPRVFTDQGENVVCLAFSPDGARLAFAGRDGTVRLWDWTGDGPPLLLKGHTDRVECLAFSPDGARLASGARDGTLRLWDADRGVGLCVFHCGVGYLMSVAFSPDGNRLACGGHDGAIRLYDGRLWTPQKQAEEEARGLVEGLFARPLLKADVIAQLRDCKGIDEEARRRALTLADGYRDDAGRFNQAGRDVVRWRDAPASLYARALDWAQTACRLAPDDGACLTTLGGAQYRVGHDADAVATLARAVPLNQGDDAERATDLAFLAMAHHRLGHDSEAAAALARLREAMTKAAAVRSEEARSSRAEAEALLQGRDE
jgi:WD40 repeat protein